MAKNFKPLDLTRIKTYSLSTRTSKVSTADFAKTHRKGASFKDFLYGLPDILAGSDLRSVISAITAAAEDKKAIILGMGAHVIKVGLSPVVIDLMERGIVTCVAMNGAGIIHDVELAMVGHTSEDVASAIDNGSFGMAEDTAVFLGKALADPAVDSEGLGLAVGHAIQQRKQHYHRFRQIVSGVASRNLYHSAKKAALQRAKHPCGRFSPGNSGHRPCRHRNGYYPHASRV